MTHFCISHFCSEELLCLYFSKKVLQEFLRGQNSKFHPEFSFLKETPCNVFYWKPTSLYLQVWFKDHLCIKPSFWIFQFRKQKKKEYRALWKELSSLSCRSPSQGCLWHGPACHIQSATIKAADEIWELNSHAPVQYISTGGFLVFPSF